MSPRSLRAALSGASQPAANEPYRAEHSDEAAWLSIKGIAARWSCGKTFVYTAIAEMQRAGYLRRLQLGRVQRIAVRSVERYEDDHLEAAPPLRAERRATPAPRASGVGAAIRALKIT